MEKRRNRVQVSMTQVMETNQSLMRISENVHFNFANKIHSVSRPIVEKARMIIRRESGAPEGGATVILEQQKLSLNPLPKTYQTFLNN